MCSKKKIIFLFSIIVFLLSPQKVNAQVLINEFSPRNPEWVEIINKSNSEINLSGYYFDDDLDFNSDSGNSSKILLQGLLPSNSLCYIDVNSYLNDGGDVPTLFASNGDISDTYTYASSSANLSYSRVPDGGDWQVNIVPSKTQGSCLSLPTPVPTQSPTNPPTVQPTSTPTVSPTKSPTPIPTKSPTARPTPTVIPTEEPLLSVENNQQNLVLGDIIVSTPSPFGEVKGAATESKSRFLAFVLLISGSLFLGYGGYLLYNQRHANKEKFEENS